MSRNAYHLVERHFGSGQARNNLRTAKVQLSRGTHDPERGRISIWKLEDGEVSRDSKACKKEAQSFFEVPFKLDPTLYGPAWPKALSSE